MARLIFIFLLFSNSVFAQQYYVLYLKGKIQNIANQQLIKVGDKISDQDAVKFLSKDAKAVVISNKAGRFVLKPESEKADNELQNLVSTVLFPDKANIQLSSRTALNKDMQGYFGEKFAIIDTELAVPFDSLMYPASNHVFVFRFKNENGAVSEKILPVQNGKLVFNKFSLFENHPDFWENESTNGELVYFEEQTENEKIVAKFTLNFIDEDLLYAALQPFCEQFLTNNFEKSEIIVKIEEFVTEFYGKTNPEELLLWIDRKNLLSKP